MSYTKLFSSIVTSTIWTEDPKICKIWVTMLAIADRHGEVHASIPGLAQIAGMELADTETAINKFLSPDKYSRTPDDEGRRIEKIEGGWLLLNHAKYRAMASKDEEKTASAKRQAAFRERQKRNGKVTGNNGPVTGDNAPVTKKLDIADSDSKAETEPKKEKVTLTLPFPSDAFKATWEKWIKYRKEIKKPITPTMVESQLKNLAAMGEERAIAMIEHTIGKGWQGLVEPDQGSFGQFHQPKKPKYTSCL